jgi:hypothetical protein
VVILTIPLSMERCALGKKNSIAIVNAEGELEKESSSYERQDNGAEIGTGSSQSPFSTRVDQRGIKPVRRRRGSRHLVGVDAFW